MSMFLGLDFNVDSIRSWLTYDPYSPLLFTTSMFWYIFSAFYLVYVFTRNCRTFRNGYVILFSLFFYYNAGGYYFIILIFSIIYNFIFSELMDLSRKKWKRKLYLIISIVVNLGVLGYYKYCNFFVDNINSLFSSNFSIDKIILPIGISFYTFQALSYSIDLYKREMKPARNILDFAFYLSFFPQLISGPIVRAKNFLPQIDKKPFLSEKDFGLAMFMIITGLVKKAVISDYISQNFVDRIYDSPSSFTVFENLMATYGYTIQIYCDFSGYSDIAIGLALLMGFTLPKNFNFPYKSTSLTEFWKRWHISLSTWLRDYLYIPLGGNRKGGFRTYFNLFITMLIGGLWHGASWKFIVWGGLHGLMLAIEKFMSKYIKLPSNLFTRLVGLIFTFHFVSFCWVFFRAEDFDAATTIIDNISKLEFVPEDWWTIIVTYKNVFILMLIGYVTHFLPENVMQKIQAGFLWIPFPIKAIMLGFIFWLVYATASSEVQPFIYFQF